MKIKEKLKNLRNGYVIHQVRRSKLPDFETGRTCRYSIVFHGRVQKVGFRLEVSELAKRLELTGFCRNCSNGDVLAELQGDSHKIEYLIAYMEHLKRIKITDKRIEELEVRIQEKDFLIQ